MASYFYDKHVPDGGDPANKTGTAPGFRFCVCEQDAAIGIEMDKIEESRSATINPKTHYSALINIKEAKELLAGLQQAIDRAASKTGGKDLHEDRVRDL